jgi:hypothetical protein
VAEFAQEMTKFSADREANHASNRQDALDAIQKGIDPDQHQNLNFLVNYLSTPKDARTPDDTKQFENTLGNLLNAYGIHTDSIYRAWEQRPQPSLDE